MQGRQLGLSPLQTKMGLAIAEDPLGPFVKYEGNPALDGGREVCVWPHREGVAAIVAPVGPQGKTTRYSPDGVHFAKMADIEPPSAPGPFCEGRYRKGFGRGITWDLSQDVWTHPDRPFLLRFECKPADAASAVR